MEVTLYFDGDEVTFTDLVEDAMPLLEALAPDHPAVTAWRLQGRFLMNRSLEVLAGAEHCG